MLEIIQFARFPTKKSLTVNNKLVLRMAEKRVPSN